jgi:hypothetical protein
MATLWHVGDVIEVICEFDDSPTHLTTLRRVSWSFHRAVENVWTLLLGRQNFVIDYEHVDSIVHWYRHPLLRSEQDDIRGRAVRAALTALRRTVTLFAWQWPWAEQSMSELGTMFIDMPQLQSAEFNGREWLLDFTAQFGTAAQLEALVLRCPHLLTPNISSGALYCTARSGNLGCAIVLLQHGCDINEKDALGTMIAHIACKHGHHEYLEGLIDAGYDVDLNARRCLFLRRFSSSLIVAPALTMRPLERERPRPGPRQWVLPSRCVFFLTQAQMRAAWPSRRTTVPRAWTCWATPG